MKKKVSNMDDSFLFSLFCENKKIELGWQYADPIIIEPLLQMQWNARNQYYKNLFSRAISYIFSYNDEPIAQLTIQHEQDHIHIIDISVLRNYQNQGIGSTIIKDLQTTAKQTKQFITLHVSTSSPAYFLYLKLGFFDIQRNEIDIKMKWTQ